jgi:hypothetical protein
MTPREVIDETEISSEVLVLSVAQGEITVDQLRRWLEEGRAYVEAGGAENLAEELLIAVSALEAAITKIQAKQLSGAEAFDRVSAPDRILDVGSAGHTYFLIVSTF